MKKNSVTILSPMSSVKHNKKSKHLLIAELRQQLEFLQEQEEDRDVGKVRKDLASLTLAYRSLSGCRTLEICEVRERTAEQTFEI